MRFWEEFNEGHQRFVILSYWCPNIAKISKMVVVRVNFLALFLGILIACPRKTFPRTSNLVLIDYVCLDGYFGPIFAVNYGILNMSSTFLVLDFEQTHL